jgi:hypothetical protein
MDFHFENNYREKVRSLLKKGLNIFDFSMIFKSQYLHLCFDQEILFDINLLNLLASNLSVPSCPIIYLKTTEISYSFRKEVYGLKK